MTIDSETFRHGLGHYPIGLSVVTAMPADGRPAGMLVGSFASVLLDPPLVAFFPDERSTSRPRIEAARRFRLDVLASTQRNVCRRFAVGGGASSTVSRTACRAMDRRCSMA